MFFSQPKHIKAVFYLMLGVFYSVVLYSFIFSQQKSEIRAGRQTYRAAIYGRIWGDNHPTTNAHVFVTNKQTNFLYGEDISLTRRGKDDAFYQVLNLPVEQDLYVYAFHEKMPGQMAFEKVNLARNEYKELNLFFNLNFTDPGFVSIAGAGPDPGGFFSRMSILIKQSMEFKSALKLRKQLQELKDTGIDSGTERLILGRWKAINNANKSSERYGDYILDEGFMFKENNECTVWSNYESVIKAYATFSVISNNNKQYIQIELKNKKFKLQSFCPEKAKLEFLNGGKIKLSTRKFWAIYQRDTATSSAELDIAPNIQGKEQIYDEKVIFEENWSSRIINTSDWAFVDNEISSHGGHKASVVKGELFINAWNDWTQSCGIVSRREYGQNTNVTLKFKIHRIKVHNQFQTVLNFLGRINIDRNGYLPANSLVSIGGGNDIIRDLFVIDDKSNKYSLGHYVPDEWYYLEIIFFNTETKVRANGHTVSLPPYSKYHIHFGGHVEASYFDDLRILSK